MDFVELEDKLIVRKDSLLLVAKEDDCFLRIFFTSPYITSSEKDSKPISQHGISFPSQLERDKAYNQLRNLVHMP